MRIVSGIQVKVYLRNNRAGARLSITKVSPYKHPTPELFLSEILLNLSVKTLYHINNSMSSLLDKNSEELPDSALRPKNWDDYVGQEKIKENIQIIISAAKERGESPDHLLFYGSSGLGKTTLAQLVAIAMGKKIRITSGPAIERAGDLAAILTNLQEGDVLFLDEIHRMHKTIEEYIYPAMEEYKLNLILGKGPMARTMELKLPRFTIIGATTRPGLLSAPLRNRFGATFQLNFYTHEDIEKIIKRSAKLLNIQVDEEAVKTIAQRSRFTPRVANRLLKRVRDFAQVKSISVANKQIAEIALDSLEVDHMGLEPGDKKILLTIIEKFNGGPVGLQALAAAAMEEEETILDIYEPYLMQSGFIERTPKGRVASRLAYKHLQKEHPQQNNLL